MYKGVVFNFSLVSGFFFSLAFSVHLLFFWLEVDKNVSQLPIYHAFSRTSSESV